MQDDKKQSSHIIHKYVPAALLVILFYFLIDRFTGFLSIVSAFMNILQPVFLGLAIAFLANPIMMFFERLLSRFLIRENKKPNRWKLKRRKDFIRGVSTVLAVTLLIAIVAAFAVQILPQFIETVQYLINHLYEKIVGVIDWADQLTGYAFADTMEAARTDGRIYVWIDTAEKWLRDYLNLTEDNLAATVTEFSLHFGRVLVNVLISIFIAIYMLIAKESFKGYSKRFVAAAFRPDIAEFILDVSRRGNQIFYGFIIGKIIDSIIIGIICWIGMTILGLNYSMLCSFIVGVTNVIPVFGPYIGALPTVILLFVTDPPQGIIFLIYILVLQQVDGNLIGPKILGDSTGISPFWVIFAIVVGGGLFGFLGMLLGVPTIALLLYILDQLTIRRCKEKNLPEKPAEYL
ncbi:MAG: AI-2E family transporter [Lachnospiraceae bacterium]|nr:AI-2E family transporter [Lachnospiraceae bacterium]